MMPLPSSSRVSSDPSSWPTSPEGASSGAELVTADGRSLPLVATTLRAHAQGGIARLVLEQAFVNTYAETLHVTYRMPLPAEGAVSGYAFEIGGRVVRGVVDRKAAARERYEQAIARGHTAALLEQERNDIFTQKLGNLPAGETILARITVDLRLAWLSDGGSWELRFPTVIGPRYISQAADTLADARATHVKVADRDLGVRLQIELAIADVIADGKRPSSPSHALAARADGTVSLSTGTRLDRDLVVRWPVARPAVGMALAVARSAETGKAHGLVTVVPPARAANVTAVPRDLLVLLDTSGSMAGGPLDKAKQVVGLLIESLGTEDRLELIEFSNEPRRYKAEPELATAAAKQAAIRWVRARQADGGTEMRAAVLEALCTLRLGSQRQVILVTDGYVGGEQQILEALHARLPASCRLHVLGVGSAVNRSLATSLARAGRGVEVVLGIDEDAERGAKRLLDRTRRPVLTNVELAGTALRQVAPEHIPDVFEGAPLVAAVELAPEGGELVIRGQLAHETWEQRISVPAIGAGEGNAAITALFGRERVADLESRSLLEDIDDEVEALGLEFQISTRRTSWVAVDEARQVAPGPARSELVPQELPYGTSAAAFGLRPAMAPVAMPLGGAAGAAGAAHSKAGMATFEDSADASFGELETLSAPEAEFDAEEATGQDLSRKKTQAGTLSPAQVRAFDRGAAKLRAGSVSRGAPRKDEASAPPPAQASAPPPPASPAPPRAAPPAAERPVQHSVAPSKVMRAELAEPARREPAPSQPPAGLQRSKRVGRLAALALLAALLVALIALLWWLLG